VVFLKRGHCPLFFVTRKNLIAGKGPSRWQRIGESGLAVSLAMKGPVKPDIPPYYARAKKVFNTIRLIT
jgi:hypothetical protein